MKPDTLRKSILEAKRFIKLAEVAYATETDKNHEYCNGGYRTAAAKRASMDLTRILADLRQGR